MKPLRFLLLALGALALSPVLLAPAALHARAAPAKDWTRTVTRTAEGAHVLGNPAAKHRLVEYVSYTCPHCAHFVAEGTGPLKSGWIARGTLAVEVRNLVRDRFDMTAALLARCGGTARFFGNHEALFANQDAWLDKARAYKPALPANASQAAAMADIADRTGLFALMEKRGVTPAQGRACLADAAALEQVLAMTRRAVEQDGVQGTPSFLVDGKLTQAHDWAGLRPLLPAPAN